MKSNLSSSLRKMSWSRLQNTLPIKLLLLSLLLLLLLFLLLLRPSPSPTHKLISECNPKLPQTLAETIIHYATSNTTPQQTLPEISLTAETLRLRSPSRFLVFGLGLDSPMWSSLNHNGRTIFLEQDQTWISTILSKFPSLETYHVQYHTKLRHADSLMLIGRQSVCSSSKAVAVDLRASECGLVLKGLPDVFYEVEWDLIMVDAPTGWMKEAPGRMGAIYTAGMVARRRRGEGETDVFVHDVDRKVEDQFSKEFLCQGYLVEQVGRLRHFRIPSFLNKDKEMPFCPSV